MRSGPPSIRRVLPAIAATLVLGTSIRSQSSATHEGPLPPLIRVQVVDAERNPVEGAPVGLALRQGPLRTIRLGTTDARGLVEGRRPDFFALQRVSARLDYPVARPQSVKFDPAAKGPIVLQAAECGSLRLWIRAAEGVPWKVSGAIFRSLISGTWFAGTIGDGFVDFSHVDLGLHLHVLLTFEDPAGGSRQTELKIRGPTRPHELMVLDVAQPGGPVSRFLVIGRDGNPARDLELTAVAGPDVLERGTIFRTDSAGYLEIGALASYIHRGAGSLALCDRTGASGFAGSIVIEPQSLVRRSGSDAGAVGLRLRRTKLQGQVTDVRGRPLPQLEVTASLPGATAADGDRRPWSFTAKTDRIGRFSISVPTVLLSELEQAPDLGLEVRTLHRGGIAYALRAAQSGPRDWHEDIAVSAVRHGIARARVTHAQPPFDGVFVLESNAVQFSATADGDGQVLWDPVEPGEYELSMRARHGDRRTKVGRVHVAESGVTSLPPIDWTQHYRAITVTVCDADGAPVTGARWAPVSPKRPLPDAWEDWSEFPIATCVDAAGIDLAVAHPEYLTQTFRGVRDSDALQLVPRPTIELHVPRLERLNPLVVGRVLSLQGGDSPNSILPVQEQGARFVKGRINLRPDRLGRCAIKVQLAIGWNGAETLEFSHDLRIPNPPPPTLRVELDDTTRDLVQKWTNPHARGR